MKLRRILLTLLLLCLTVGALTLCASAAEIDSGMCGPKATWSLKTDGTLTISGEGAMYDYSGMDWYGTDPSPWYGYRGQIKRINVQGVTYIGEFAFEYCTEVENVTISATVQTIGEYAFSFCESLQSITIPGSVTTIKKAAFSGCVDLASITLLEGVRNVEMSAFGYIHNELTNPDAPQTVSVFLPASLVNLDPAAFWSNDEIRHVLYGGTEAHWANLGFAEAFPKKDIAVHCNASGNEVTVHNGCEYHIGHCTICNKDFACIRLYELHSHNYSNGVCTLCGLKEGWDYTLDANAVAYLFGYVGEETHVVVPSYVETIVPVTCLGESRNSVIFGKHVESVVIPESVTQLLGHWGGSEKQTEIIIPENIVSIDECMFTSRENLIPITIPANIADVEFLWELRDNEEFSHVYFTGTDAQWDAISQGYSSCTVHTNATGKEATYFAGCTYRGHYCDICQHHMGIRQIGTHEYENGTCTKCGLVEGIYYTADEQGNLTIRYYDSTTKEITIPATIETMPVVQVTAVKGENLEKVTISHGIQSIDYGAFRYNTALKEVIIPDSVTSLGEEAFFGCTSLKNITIPDSITEVQASTFYGCTSLETAKLPKGLTKIDYALFRDCTSLTSVNIPDTVTEIARDAFIDCKSLTNIIIPDGVTELGVDLFRGCSALTSITIPDSITEIGYNTFNGCTALEMVKLPANLITLGSDIFTDCTSLKEIKLPESVTSIGGYCFANCSSLEAVSIPSNVTTIEYGAFKDCISLKEITLPQNLSYIYSDTFDGCSSLTTIICKCSYFDYFAEFADVTAVLLYPWQDESWKNVSASNFDGNITLCPDHCEITFVDHNGTVLSKTVYEYGETVVVPDVVPTKEADNTYTYVFSGWDKEITPATNHTTYTATFDAIYIDYTVTFKNHDGSIISSKTYHYGDDVEIPELPEVESDQPEAYYYDVSWDKNIYRVCRGDATYQVVLTPRTIYYRVYFLDWDYSTITSKAYTYGEMIVPPEDPAPYSDGNETYRFSRWESLFGSITNEVGFCTGEAYFIAVYELAPKISIDLDSVPHAIAVKKNTDATLTVNATGSNLVYKWFVKSPGGNDFVHASTTSANSFSLKMTAETTGSYVYCLVEDDQGNSVRTTDVLMHIQLELVKAPTDVNVSANSDATVTVEAIGDGLVYHWYIQKPNATEYKYVDTTENGKITIKLTPELDGSYVACLIEDRYGNGYGTDWVRLRIVNVATVTQQPKTTYTKLNGTAKVTVKASGDGLTYTWYFKNAGASKFSKSSTTSATYSTKMTATQKDRQVYCVVKDKYGNEVKTSTVYLRMAASIVTQPKTTYTKLNGTAKVTVNAQGDGLTYTWYFKNADSTKFSKSSVTSATYTAKMTDKVKNRQVYCVVKDKYGKAVTTETVYLRMAASIVTQPKTTYTKLNGTAKVTVKASGDGLTYTWYAKDSGAKKFTKTSTTSATYSVKMTSKVKDRQVYCVVKDKYGKTVTTDTVYLRMAASITTQPKTTYTKLNGTAKVTVKASGDGLTYTWYAKDAGAKKFSKTSTTSATYSVKVTDKVKNRQVYCVIKDKYGKTVTTETVYLRMAASIVTQPKTTYTKLNGTAKVTVKATGDGLTYTWYVKNAGSPKFSKSSVTSATYSAKMTDKVKNRQVYCVVVDKYGNEVKTSTVYLRMAASIVTQPKTTYTKLNGTAKVTVKASGDGLTYTWYTKDVGASKYTKSSVTSSTYSVKMTEKVKDRYVYCVVKDKYGNTVKTETVRLRMAASITKQPVNVTVAKGAKATVKLTAKGDGLTYKWYYKDAGSKTFKLTTSFKSSTYSLTMSKSNTGRQVYCVVTDKYGNSVKSNVVTLKMK